MNFFKRLNFLFNKTKSDKPIDFYSNMSKQQLKKRLTQQQWHVTQQNGTQKPYKNQFYNCKKTGMYHCVVCDIPLFSSETKYDSGCGWPAFYDQLKDANIKKNKDYSFGMVRTEVRCGSCDAHLGHIFQDGPKDKTGVRYCINSASMNFYEKK